MQSLEWSNELQQMFRQKEKQSVTAKNFTKNEKSAIKESTTKANQNAQIAMFWE